MSCPSPGHRRKPPSPNSDHLQHSQLLRPAGPTPSLRLTKLLLKVTIHNSVGPVQVFMCPDDSVADLVKAALFIYHRDKRRPFLKATDPNRYALHYSPFCLDSLKWNERLRNLGSRNFFLCLKSSTTSSTCSEAANNITMDSAFPLMMFVHHLML
ncbi:uncharacterized protein G2W53_019529 [Senna tora]|uniref:DUF7054 domain-containing protein n=1 Tax=Senna tora TaxID=362788 RepID=A0A834WM23_9FABA|nr:uncharacterized protein G2W53_019529 [Senna tora]